MVRKLLLGACGVGLLALFAMFNLSGSETAADVGRVAPSPLLCDFDNYEGIGRYEEASQGERDVYALGMGYSNYGAAEDHEALLAAFEDLRFDPVNAPIVSADLEQGRLHVFDCAGPTCSRTEIATSAPRACRDAFDGNTCRTFAVRVNNVYYCTLGPGLIQ